MLAVELPKDIEARLERLSRKTGRSKADYVREAVIEYLEALGDEEILSEEAMNALTESEDDIAHGRTQSLEDLRREMGL